MSRVFDVVVVVVDWHLKTTFGRDFFGLVGSSVNFSLSAESDSNKCISGVSRTCDNTLMSASFI